MKKILTLITILFVSMSFGQTIITQWNFDSSTTTPSTGTGTITLVGGTVEAGTPYPQGNPTTGKAYNITSFPSTGAASGTAGFQFNVNTTGYNGISVTFDTKGSNTSSKWQQYQYTTNGSTWITLGNNNGGLTASFTATPMVVLSFPPSANNNPNFAFRIVSIFDPSTNDYSAISGTYAGTGTWRVDNVSFVLTSTLSTNQNLIGEVKVFPNPCSSEFVYITSNSQETKIVDVYDILGKNVLSTTTNDRFSVSSLESGIYLVRITEGDNSLVRKLVVK